MNLNLSLTLSTVCSWISPWAKKHRAVLTVRDDGMSFSSVVASCHTVPFINFWSANRHITEIASSLIERLLADLFHWGTSSCSKSYPVSSGPEQILGWRVPGWVSIINSSELPLECNQQVSNSLESICCAECFPQKVAWGTLTLSRGLDWDISWIPLSPPRSPAEIWHVSHRLLPEIVHPNIAVTATWYHKR